MSAAIDEKPNYARNDSGSYVDEKGGYADVVSRTALSSTSRRPP